MIFSRKDKSTDVFRALLRWLPDVLFVGGATMLAKLCAESPMAAVSGNARNIPFLREFMTRPESWEIALAAFVAALGLDLVLRRTAIWR